MNDYKYDVWKKNIWNTVWGYQFSVSDDESCISFFSKKDANFQTRQEAKNACDEMTKYCQDMVNEGKGREVLGNLQELFPKYI